MTDTDNRPGSVNNPLPTDTTKPEPKVVNATLSAAGVVGVIVMVAQLLYDRADLIKFLPDELEAPLMAIVTAIVTYGAGYASRHQFRRNRAQGSSGTTLGNR